MTDEPKQRGPSQSFPDSQGAFRERYRRNAGADLSDPAIKARVTDTQRDLSRIIKDYLNDDPDLHELAEQIAKNGDQSLRMLRDDDAKLATGSKHAGDLEAIIRIDGSRPSFMIRNGVVDTASSPIGTWQDTLTVSAERLPLPISCVGRIDLDDAHVGTGFLVQEDVICTNRHVLQEIADRQGLLWQLKPRATIDFGLEFRGQDSLDRRTVTEVLFSGVDDIEETGPINHTKLDLVLLRTTASAKKSLQVLSVDRAPDWADPDLDIYAIGYPAKPGPGYTPTLLEQLFKLTWGKKRLAPGLTVKAGDGAQAWTFGHDATTLGGNSGSLVLAVGRETLAAGIHYGGRRGELAVNWGHVFGRALSAPDLAGQGTLEECCARLGVKLVDRL